MLKLSHEACDAEAYRVAVLIAEYMRAEPRCESGPIKIYAVPRGGVPATYLIIRHLKYLCVEREEVHLVDDPCDAHVIVDDLIDSGATKIKYQMTGKPFFALFTKGVNVEDTWLVFPWEEGETDKSAEDIPLRLLQFIGEDTGRGGLQETPARFLKAWQFYTSGYDKKPEDILKVFEDGADKCDEMVLVRDIPFYSQCEHHLAPFFGVAHVAYIPNGRIVGLSKLSRLVDMFARRLQVQERLTNQVADALFEHLQPLGVGVIMQARHMCMESRGVCQQGHSTVTSALRGVFKEELDTRNEFMRLTK